MARLASLLLFGITCSSFAACLQPVAVAEEVSDAKIELTDGTWKDLQQYVAEQKGKIVVVDIWSTSCLPCMKEFPGLVKLAGKHADDVVCVSFNVDYAGIKSKPPEYYRERVTKFLTGRNAAFRNYLSTEEADKVFDSLKLPSIPAVIVYGRDGKAAKRFDSSLLTDDESEAFTYQDDIAPFVAGLVAGE